ncbi:M48 family metalloprotease [Micromonospora sp. WMMD734]|uniref:M48 family metalloprotease n=1 Tax=Micromonospora sp. WMMD734 TaxID=3404129 RepID=UPI003B960657
MGSTDHRPLPTDAEPPADAAPPVVRVDTAPPAGAPSGAAAVPGPPPAGLPRRRRPTRLRWLHLLMLLCLAGVGVAAGDAVFVVHDLGRWGEVQACAALDDLPPDGGEAARLLGRGARYDRCAAGFELVRGLAQLGGAVGVLGLAGVAVLLDGLSARHAVWRRVRRRPAGERGVAVVRERFEHWCDTLGLDRRRPRLVVAPVGVRQAYTTAVPFGRPLVVVPVAHAYGRPDLLDLVLLHELAHVRARDVAWASATRWTGGLILPVLVLVVTPVLVDPGPATRYYVLTLPVTALFAAGTLLSRAAVLRRREHAADRFAVDHADLRDALAAAGGDDDPPRRARWWWPGRWLARHPTGAQRVRALDREPRWEDGFTVAVVAGLVAMFGFQSLLRPLTHGVGAVAPGDAGDVAMAVAALCWAVVVVPLWSRRPASVRRRWSRMLGSGLGLAGGYLLPGFGATSPVYGVFLAGFHLGAFAALLPVLVGVGTVAVGFAEAVARVPSGIRRRLTLVVTVLAVAALLTAVLTTATLLVFGHWAWHSGPIDRALWSTPGFAARVALPAVPLAALLLVRRPTRARRPPRPAASPPDAPPAPVAAGPRRLIALILLTGGTAVVAGLAATELVAGRTAGGDAFFLLFLRWWLCASAGWWVASVVLLARGVRGTAVAWTAGVGVTVAAGSVQFARDVVAGVGPAPAHLLAFLERPAWLLLAALVVTSPPVLLLRELWTGCRAWARRRRPARRHGPWASWPPPVLAALVAVAVAGGVAAGWTAPVTGRAGDWDLLRSARVEPAAPDDGRPRPAARDPGRPLDRAAVDAALAEARRSLPADWTPASGLSPFGVTDPAGVRPSACADRFAADARAERARPASAEGTVVLAVPATTLPPLGATFQLRLTSYPSADAAARVLAAARQAVTACPRWSYPSALADGGVAHRWTVAMPRADLPYDSLRVRITDSSTVGGLPAVAGGTRVVVAVGRTVLSAEIALGIPFRDQLEPKERLLLDDLAVVGARLVVHALDS